MTLDLGKFEFRVVRVHFLDLFACWRSEDFDDFYELVDTGVAREDRLSQQ